MANWTLKNIALRGISACVPENKVLTKDMSIFTPSECEKFLEGVGIESRRVVPEGVCASDLCYEAAEKLIAELKWDKSEIGALVFVSVTADYRSPMTSCILQDRLGLPTTCFTLDIPLACCGYLHGMTVLANLMQSGTIKKGLLLAGDTCYQMSSPEDKSRLPIFGDAGTASAYEYDETADDILSYSCSDGSGYEAIITPHSGFRHPVTPESFIMQDFEGGIRRAPVHGMLDGMEVFSFAISKAPKICKQLMEEHNIAPEEVDYYVLHQANGKINDYIRNKMKIEPEKMPSCIEEFGNTSCTTIPLLMVSRLREPLITKSLNLILLAFGVGLTWGCVNIKTNRIVCPELMELKNVNQGG
jgi:3-oxoacyl-[acyl-carrier-protein] synthase-3